MDNDDDDALLDPEEASEATETILGDLVNLSDPDDENVNASSPLIGGQDLLGGF